MTTLCLMFPIHLPYLGQHWTYSACQSSFSDFGLEHMSGQYLSKGWIEATDFAAAIIRKGISHSQQLQVWAKNFIWDQPALPYHRYEKTLAVIPFLTSISLKSWLLILLTPGHMFLLKLLLTLWKNPRWCSVIKSSNWSVLTQHANGWRSSTSSGRNHRKAHTLMSWRCALLSEHSPSHSCSVQTNNTSLGKR